MLYILPGDDKSGYHSSFITKNRNRPLACWFVSSHWCIKDSSLVLCHLTELKKNMLFFLKIIEKSKRKALQFVLSYTGKSSQLFNEQDDLDDARKNTAVWCGNVKKLNFVAAILDFWRPYLIDLISLYSISIVCTNFGTFKTKWTVDTPVMIFYHCFTMQTGSSYCKLFLKFSSNVDQI